MRVMDIGGVAAITAVLIGPAALQAQPAAASFAVRLMTPETALKAAQATLAACRGQSAQVAVAVVDRAGLPQVLLRDRFAGPHTVDMAINKAWTAASFRTATSELGAQTQAGRPMSGIRNLPRVIAAGGGLAIEAGGSPSGARSACPARPAARPTSVVPRQASTPSPTTWHSERQPGHQVVGRIHRDQARPAGVIWRWRCCWGERAWSRRMCPILAWRLPRKTYSQVRYLAAGVPASRASAGTTCVTPGRVGMSAAARRCTCCRSWEVGPAMRWCSATPISPPTTWRPGPSAWLGREKTAAQIRHNRRRAATTRLASCKSL